MLNTYSSFTSAYARKKCLINYIYQHREWPLPGLLYTDGVDEHQCGNEHSQREHNDQPEKIHIQLRKHFRKKNKVYICDKA